MRVDKFLWCVRYFKTRNIATTACKKGHIKVDGLVVKPSREVYPTNKIVIRKDQINYEIIVNDIPSSRVGAKLVDIYRTDMTPKEAFKSQDQLKFAKDYYRKKGTGRPTKKDRRDLENLNDDYE
jgi:ribosome-associated heat shock protein Hsp15